MVNIESFSLYDIVIWNGTIATYGAIKSFVLPGDLVIMASEEDREKYLKLRENKS